MDETRARIIEAAESLFVERGFGQTSLRAITTRAGVNLAAVNYHFGSKDGLIRELASLRVKPVNAERMRRLNVLRRRNALTLESALEAFLGPLLQAADAAGITGRSDFLRLLGSSQAGMSGPLREYIRALDSRILEAFEQALAEVLPDLPRHDVHWRIRFLNGLVSHLLGQDDGSGKDDGAPAPMARLPGRLMPFLVGGFRAPGSVDPSTATIDEAVTRESARVTKP